MIVIFTSDAATLTNVAPTCPILHNHDRSSAWKFDSEYSDTGNILKNTAFMLHAIDFQQWLVI